MVQKIRWVLLLHDNKQEQTPDIINRVLISNNYGRSALYIYVIQYNIILTLILK